MRNTIDSEFAVVQVSVDDAGNGPRLKLEDLKSEHVGYLDALELETLAWLPEGALHPLLDPSMLRFTEQPAEPTITELVRALYAALLAGDRDALLGLLADDFECTFAEGMPLGIGGHLRGAEAMIERGWWALGRAFKVQIGPTDWIPCAGGRLLVVGRYEGRARSTDKQFTANLIHLWSARDDRLASLWHLTDTAAWMAALEP